MIGRMLAVIFPFIFLTNAAAAPGRCDTKLLETDLMEAVKQKFDCLVKENSEHEKNLEEWSNAYDALEKKGESGPWIRIAYPHKVAFTTQAACVNAAANMLSNRHYRILTTGTDLVAATKPGAQVIVACPTAASPLVKPYIVIATTYVAANQIEEMIEQLRLALDDLASR